ncbi:MAG: methyltransferase domain-containing protein [Acidimicrobiia bacterium]
MSELSGRSECVTCGSEARTRVLSLESMPALINQRFPDAASARSAPRGDVELFLCDECGMIANAAFDPKLVEYSPAYENSLHFSPTFERYAEGLAKRLVETYDLHYKVVVEVGCGKGEFLSLLCQAGNNRGVGFDPSYGGELDDFSAARHMRFVPQLFPEPTHTSFVDLVCARHVLEHTADPNLFLHRIARAVGNQQAVVYLEVPNATYMLRSLAVWDVIYEHVLYLSPVSLARLVHEQGFDIRALGTAFDAQYLFVEAQPSTGHASGRRDDSAIAELRELAARFEAHLRTTVDTWRSRLEELEGRGRRIALWGAGSKGGTFLNVVPGADLIEWVVDVNPRKQGTFITGTGHRIVAPEQLAGVSPDVVIVLNPIYVPEVSGRLRELAIDAEVIGPGAEPVSDAGSGEVEIDLRDDTARPGSDVRTRVGASASSGCVTCRGETLTPVLRIESVPALVNRRWHDAESARAAPRGAIELVLCEECGMIYNAAFDPSLVEHTAAHESSLHFSPTLARHEQSVAERLIKTYDVRGKEVLEIGYGKGEFLELICAAGGNRGVGYDPSYDGELDDVAAARNIRFVRELLPEAGHARAADLVCSRHVLEYDPEPRAFLGRLGRAIGDASTILDFEVPDALYMLRELAIWGVSYEQPLYFCAPSLSRLVREMGFEVVETGPTFGGQYLYLQASRPGGPGSVAPAAEVTAELWELGRSFGRGFEAVVQIWRERLEELEREGRRVALWGAGSEGVTFLNVVPGADRLEWVVDINRRKQGAFVAGTGQRIMAPEQLASASPDVVIVLNPLYASEVRAWLRELAIDAEVIGPGGAPVSDNGSGRVEIDLRDDTAPGVGRGHRRDESAHDSR